MQKLFRLLIFFKSVQHVSDDKFAHPQEHFLTVYTAFGTMHRSAAVSVHCTKSCIYSQKVLLKMGEFVARYMSGWFKKIKKKKNLLHVVCCLHHCAKTMRGHKHKVYQVHICLLVCVENSVNLFLNYLQWYKVLWPPLWSSGQSFWLQIQRSRVRFQALPDFLSSSASGTGSTQPREVNWGATWTKSSGSGPENRD